MLKNSEDSFGWIQITIHWLSAIAVIGLFAVGLWMMDLDYYSDWYHTAPHYHQSVGLLLALLTLFRIVWSFTNKRPKDLSTIAWQNMAAHAAHILLYILLILLFFSGYLIVTLDGESIELFNWFEIPSFVSIESDAKDWIGLAHEWGAYALIALAVVHALAAIKHHFIDKDATLTRMLKPQNHED